MTQNHTPTPWTIETVQTSVGFVYKIGPFPWIGDKVNHACIYVDYNNNAPTLKANAEFIVRACNAHDDLVDALEAVLEAYRDQMSQEYDFRASSWEDRPDEVRDNAINVLAKAKSVQS